MPESSGKSRVDKLDEALLSLISLTSIIFTVIQAFFGGLSFILYSIPLLTFGVLAPFYYGYWRGALEDSAIMRVRGWIYLYFGTVGYVTMVIYLNVWRTQNPIIIAVGVILVFLFLFTIGVYRYILYYIFNACNREVSSFDARIAFYTVEIGASFLILFFWCAFNLPSPRVCGSSTNSILCFLFTYLEVPFLMISSWVSLELACQKMLKNYERLYCEIVFFERLREKHGGFIKVLRFLLIFLIIAIPIFVALMIKLSLLEWDPLYIPALCTLVLGLVSLALILSSSEIVYKWGAFRRFK